MGEIMTKDRIITILTEAGNRIDTAMQYADVFLEYREATENIDRNGIIVQHPRTQNPIDNPYLRVRDNALKKLTVFGKVRGADKLWESTITAQAATPANKI